MLDTTRSLILTFDARILETCSCDMAAYVDEILDTTRSLILTLDARILDTCSCDTLTYVDEMLDVTRFVIKALYDIVLCVLILLNITLPAIRLETFKLDIEPFVVFIINVFTPRNSACADDIVNAFNTDDTYTTGVYLYVNTSLYIGFRVRLLSVFWRPYTS